MGAFQLYFQEMYRDVSGRYPGMAMAELIQIVAEDYRNLDDAIKDCRRYEHVQACISEADADSITSCKKTTSTSCM
jgi:hypothetical protein